MNSWDVAWLDQAHASQDMVAWRGVEAQHVVSTMRLVDTLKEQDVLEQLLEQIKPALPHSKVLKHYLLATPLRYRPQHSSRFRRVGTQGLWYGAENLNAACAEVAYWRYRFILDNVPLLDSELLTEHTFLHAKVLRPRQFGPMKMMIPSRRHWLTPRENAACNGSATSQCERQAVAVLPCWMSNHCKLLRRTHNIMRSTAGRREILS